MRESAVMRALFMTCKIPLDVGGLLTNRVDNGIFKFNTWFLKPHFRFLETKCRHGRINTYEN